MNDQIELNFNSKDNEEIKEIEILKEKLYRYQYEYYVLARTTVSDAEYDSAFDRLLELENKYPEHSDINSPTKRVGSDLASDLPEVRHTIPVLSLDKSYTNEELISWIQKINKNSAYSHTVIAEEKIDGISIVLYYVKGLLSRAVTRGNGYTGNDVTANVKTIGSVPLKLKENIDLTVRGEIYLPLKEFERINKDQKVPYANPRNLAAGTIRRKKSSEVKNIPLDVFIYEGYFSGKSFDKHTEIIEKLSELGFRMNSRTAAFSDSEDSLSELSSFFQTGKLENIADFIKKETDERHSLAYEIDGLVFKINDTAEREVLGYTGHHPRWAIAYKFESDEKETTVNSIDIQIGRTGRVTPVARIEPVKVAGSTVSNVTLHNQDYIDFLGLSVGDRVVVSKRGDVIPAVESVVEKKDINTENWHIPSKCPFCGTVLETDGAHTFCTNNLCIERKKGQLKFFASREQMDIENLGDETIDFLIDEELISDWSDIYNLDYSQLAKYPGFGDKKIELIKKGVSESRNKSFITVLSALGIPELGPKACELIIKSGLNTLEKITAAAENKDYEALTSVIGIGEKTAETVIKYFSDKNFTGKLFNLQKAGLSFSYEQKDEKINNSMENQVWCISGSFENFKPRSEAGKEIEKRGGRIVSQVTGKTTHLLAGSSPGSKLQKAELIGAVIVNEADFLEILKKEE